MTGVQTCALPISILPYYIANLNIEFSYSQIMGEYAEFPHICFVDTLDNLGFAQKYKGGTDDLFSGGMTAENTERVKKQNAKKISVIIGNPPYNANQLNENDNNKNRTYAGVDKRIKETYIHESTAQKTKLYDMYARFLRWASDRLDENGVVVRTRQAGRAPASVSDESTSMRRSGWCRRR